MGSFGFESKSSHHTEGGLHPPLPVQTQLGRVTDCNKQLPQPSEAVLPFRSTVSAGEQEYSTTGRKSKLTGFLQPAIFGTQAQRPVLDLSTLNAFFKLGVVQKGDPRGNKNLPIGRGVGHIHRLLALQRGIRIHQYLDDWLVRASTHDTCLQHTQTLVTLCQELGWLVKSQNWLPTGFQLRRLPVRP